MAAIEQSRSFVSTYFERGARAVAASFLILAAAGGATCVVRRDHEKTAVEKDVVLSALARNPNAYIGDVVISDGFLVTISTAAEQLVNGRVVQGTRRTYRLTVEQRTDALGVTITEVPRINQKYEERLEYLAEKAGQGQKFKITGDVVRGDNNTAQLAAKAIRPVTS